MIIEDADVRAGKYPMRHEINIWANNGCFFCRDKVVTRDLLYIIGDSRRVGYFVCKTCKTKFIW